MSSTVTRLFATCAATISAVNSINCIASIHAPRNRRFEEYVGCLNAFAPPVRSEEDLNAAVDRAVIDAVTSLTHLGVREARKGRFYSGDALEWSKLSFAEREDSMVTALETGLTESGGKQL